MDFNFIEQLYIHGEYQKILDLLLNKKSELYEQSKDKIGKAIINSYHSRSLIRLGKVKESEIIIKSLESNYLNKDSELSEFINETSLLNLLITLGKSEAVIERKIDDYKGEDFFSNLRKKDFTLMEFWTAYYFYLFGIAYYYELNYEQSIHFFQKSLQINESNFFIMGKSYYYLAFIELELNNEQNFEKYIDKSMEIYQKINAKQGIGWILIWKGNLHIQKGEYELARNYLDQAYVLFKKIGGKQELNVIRSLFGLIYFQKGELTESEQLLNESFSSSIKLGNPMLSSYILLPFIFVNINAGNRKFIEENLKIFEDFNKDSRVSFHLRLGKAIFLKSSTKFYDKAKSEELFIELLKKAKSDSNYLFTTGNKSIKFFLTINLAEIYYLEFLISNDMEVVTEIQQLLDDFENDNMNVKANELVEISILKSKILVVEGKIENSLNELTFAREIAIENGYIELIDQIEKETNMIHAEIDKWRSKESLLDRVKAVDMELYIKEAQKIAKT